MLRDRVNRTKKDYTSNWIIKAKNIVLNHIDTDQYAVFLFGSRAANLSYRSSDLDIGVLGKKPLDRKVINSIKQEVED